jgi:hypothetical protein
VWRTDEAHPPVGLMIANLASFAGYAVGPGLAVMAGRDPLTWDTQCLVPPVGADATPSAVCAHRSQFPVFAHSTALALYARCSQFFVLTDPRATTVHAQ